MVSCPLIPIRILKRELTEYREVGSTKVKLTDIGRSLIWADDEESSKDASKLKDHVVSTTPHHLSKCLKLS